MSKSCDECAFHEAFWDEGSDGQMYDDGCLCNNESNGKIDYHFANCYVYSSIELIGCPYFKAVDGDSNGNSF